ncbi:3-oxoacyl-[acyl-carrier-protein] reductase [Desulfomonile tiedjei]|uniref:3-oxoacyl-[acyl-carrier-protein] reductase n=1 Tax=Desulfomonile tiedjei (strain ATCC 49306 / DSM 6799 / DCB-1) TaxID=706587 RepID=I4C2G1_DESTA|nr:3-oxoacyl-[acyl-carrier-protein] reductase [Desulfomonile tiedjei]AFM23752.1 3-oxoacyl-(acyl-carrier-protein) reductase [Desulfomonile tiedjei DSM 6799]
MIPELISLHGQTALVTGGSRGIGSAIALELARAGAYVIINYRTDEASANLVAEKIRHSGGQATVKGFDVSDPQAVDRAIAETVQERNGIDILVSNAGITRDGLIGRMKDTDWNEVVSTNLSGVFYLCRSVSKNMIRRRKGRIITISSTAGEAGNPGQANYSAAKAGLIGFTKALARELAPRNILVNSVSPGIIAGGMTDQLTEDQMEAIRSHVPLRRTGKPEDVAAAVLFLCSGMSEYITGQVIRVNGGLYM